MNEFDFNSIYYEIGQDTNCIRAEYLIIRNASFMGVSGYEINRSDLIICRLRDVWPLSNDPPTLGDIENFVDTVVLPLRCSIQGYVDRVKNHHKKTPLIYGRIEADFLLESQLKNNVKKYLDKRVA